MTMRHFNLKSVDPSWLTCLNQGLSQMESAYLTSLLQSDDWLPGPEKIFNAFSLPLHKVNYVLFGESPYPRRSSANGYAFWDAAVNQLWSCKGMNKAVNRATSLRNIIKMLLVAEGLLNPDDLGQEAIAKMNKTDLIQTNDALFQRLLEHGFLLLNATPVLQAGAPQKDARVWSVCIREWLKYLLAFRPHVKLILFGRIANTIDALLPTLEIEKLYAEHPYNLSFITNARVLDFFRPLHLLYNTS